MRKMILLVVFGLVAAVSYAQPAAAASGNALAWGSNSIGQLGNGASGFGAHSKTPVDVSNLSGVQAIDGGNAHSLALTSEGTVFAWGGNYEGQLGDGTNTDRNTPVKVSNLITEAQAIAAGCEHSLALKEDGTVFAWGNNYEGQLGNGASGFGAGSNTPVQVEDANDATGYLTNVKAISAGCRHSLALKEDGTVLAWGSNNEGQLGDDSNNDSNMPVQVRPLTDVKAIAVGGWHSLALEEDGTVFAWGLNSEGQLGDGNGAPGAYSDVPVKVKNLTKVKAIAAGGDHSLALKEDGRVWAWGGNSAGQVGNGTNSLAINTPVQVIYLTKVQAIAGGGYRGIFGGEGHSLALKEDGTVFAWGYNGAGQLGDGTTTDRNGPVQVQLRVGRLGFPSTPLSGVKAIGGGSSHSLAATQ